MPHRHVLLANRLEKLESALPALAEGAPDAVHDARVATRRLRELLPLLDVPPERSDQLRRDLRAATRRLGRVRELDVLLELVSRMSRALELQSTACDRLAELARAERARELDHASAPRLRDALRQLAESMRMVQRDLAATASARDEAGWRRAISARVEDRARTAAARLNDAGTAYVPERLHALRVSIKKLRYAIELAAEAADAPPSRDLRELVRAQDELGRLHDFEILTARACAARAGDALPATVDDALAEAIGALELRCRELHTGFLPRMARLARVLARHGATEAIASQAS